jgi:hypothetical protein
VAQLEQWLERERDRLQREEFREHLNHASSVVATWPEWERNIFWERQNTGSVNREE